MVAEQVLADCAVGLPEDRERVSVLLGVAPLQLLVESAARLERPVWLKALREHGLAEAQAQSICDSIAAEFTPWQERPSRACSATSSPAGSRTASTSAAPTTPPTPPAPVRSRRCTPRSADLSLSGLTW